MPDVASPIRCYVFVSGKAFNESRGEKHSDLDAPLLCETVSVGSGCNY